MKKKLSKIKSLLFFLKGTKVYFALAIVFVCIQVVFDLVNPKIMGYTVDYIIENESHIPLFIMNYVEALGGRNFIMGHLWVVSLVVIGIGILSALSRYLFRLYNVVAGEKLAKRMRNVLFEQILSLPFSWHDVNKTGDIIQRCTSDVDVIRNFIAEQMVNLFRMIATIGLALYFMLNISVLLTLVVGLFIVVIVTYSMAFHGKVGEQFEKVDAEEGRLSAMAQENLAGVRVIRAFGREDYERRRFESKNEIYIGHWVVMMKILAKFWTVCDFIKGMQTCSVLALGAYITISGKISPGQFIAFISYNLLIMQPISELGRVISDMSKSGVSIDRLNYIMDSSVECDAPEAVDFPGEGDIEIKNVTFSYDNKRVLDDVSMTIGRGQTIGILGGTGSGKSTLMLLLDSLYSIDNGCITINGVDIAKIKKHELRRNIGFVLQEPYLFSRSLEENIKIAMDDAKHEDVLEASRKASLTSAIDKFKDGLDTFVGERGVTLSGGQKQRAAIAQTMIRNPKILIFDDSLSAVDARTDASIRAAIAKAGEDSTVIIISHRITTIMKSDFIYVLNDGRVAEKGTHEELVKVSGIYKKIFDMQRAEDADY